MPEIEFFCPGCNEIIDDVIENADESNDYYWTIRKHGPDVRTTIPGDSITKHFRCPECQFSSMKVGDFIKVTLKKGEENLNAEEIKKHVIKQIRDESAPE
jgi:hypothetical protein